MRTMTQEKKLKLKNFEKLAIQILNGFKKGAAAVEIKKDTYSEAAVAQALSLVQTEINRLEKAGRPVITDESKLSTNSDAKRVRAWRQRTGRTKKPPSEITL